MQGRIAFCAVLAALLVAPRDAPAPIRFTPEGETPQAMQRDVIDSVAIDELTVTTGEGLARVTVRARALTPDGRDIVDFGDAVVRVLVDGVPIPAGDLEIAAPGDGRPGFLIGFAAEPDGATHEVRVEVGGRSAAALAAYPSAIPRWWPWAGAALAVAVITSVSLPLLRRRRALRLAFLSGPQVGRSVFVRDGTMRIGSLAENDVVLESARVSRYHAQITVRGGRAEVRDLHSSNGTYVNGNRVEQAFLSSGDKLRFGDVELLFDC